MNFTGPWSLARWNEAPVTLGVDGVFGTEPGVRPALLNVFHRTAGTDSALAVRWTGGDLGTPLTHTISFEGTSTDASYEVTALTRMACHFLLDQIPDRGLPEACSSLAEIFRYYSEPPVQPALPDAHPGMPVTVLAVQDRPEFYLDPDEE